MPTKKMPWMPKKRMLDLPELHKTFGGKKYDFSQAYSTKREADKIALSFRRIGIPARVIERMLLLWPEWPWLVYIRPGKIPPEWNSDHLFLALNNIQFWQNKAIKRGVND